MSLTLETPPAEKSIGGARFGRVQLDAWRHHWDLEWVATTTSDRRGGGGVDAAGFDAATQLAFASAGEGTLTVVREETPDRFTVVETVATKPGARTLTLDQRTHRVFLSTAQRGPAPPATASQPRPRPAIVPDTFEVLVMEP